MTRLPIIIALVLFAVISSAHTSARGVSVVPDGRSLVILLRESLVGLDQANRTGNYGVFRDLGSPRFRNANTEARLAEIFSNLRKQAVDLRSVTVLTPRFTRQPFVDKKNLLRLTGVFDMQPRPVTFDLAYELSGGQWRLFGIAVNPVTPQGKSPRTEPKKK